MPCLLFLTVLCLGAGCNAFSKRPGSAADHPPPAGGAGQAKPPEFGGDSVQPASIDLPAGSMVAGQILDNLTGKPPPEATIRVTGTSEDTGKSIEVTADSQGYFTIENLKRGQQYKLWARAKQGDKLLAGITYTSAPNIRVLVKISEDYATPDTPDVPGAPKVPNSRKPAKEQNPKGSKQEQPTAQGKPQWDSPSEGAMNPKGKASVGIGPPQALKEGSPGAQPWQHQTVPNPQTPPDTTKIAGTEFASNPPVARWQPDAGAAKPTPGNAQTIALEAPARVPSCVLVGKVLHNLALYDLQEQAWEYRKYSRGKVVLLDFWRTDCAPCVQAIPNLVVLQQKYSDQGLEVVGIAYQQQGSFSEKAQRVSGMARVKGVNYRLLLGATPDCPVAKCFGVRWLPTLVLLDQTGRIVWSHEGALDAEKRDELDWTIQSLLRNR
jgi:thiol-disulfide isomerase/thioredoxin